MKRDINVKGWLCFVCADCHQVVYVHAIPDDKLCAACRCPSQSQQKKATGYQCVLCEHVTRTYKAMRLHLTDKHGFHPLFKRSNKEYAKVVD